MSLSHLLLLPAVMLLWFAWNIIGPVAEQRRLANKPDAAKVDLLGWFMLLAALYVGYLSGAHQ